MSHPSGPSGIPTVFRGVQYRSRLEAKWGAFFSILGWSFQYEPFDCNGWIPDFMLTGGPSSVLVEVKPVVSFPADVASKIVASGAPPEILIVGATLGTGPIQLTADIGWLGDGWDNPADPTPCWGTAVFGSWSESGRTHVGFTDHDGGWFNRVGRGDGKYYCGAHRLNSIVTDAWNRAGNLVQWRGRQSEVTS